VPVPRVMRFEPLGIKARVIATGYKWRCEHGTLSVLLLVLMVLMVVVVMMIMMMIVVVAVMVVVVVGAVAAVNWWLIVGTGFCKREGV
jgi:hypothetical protein